MIRRPDGNEGCPEADKRGAFSLHGALQQIDAQLFGWAWPSRGKRHTNKLVAMSIIALASSQRVAADDSYRSFRAAYHCDVMERLKRVYAAGDPADSLNRYLAINASASDYVQCLFHERNTRVLCEASSGFWGTKPGQKRTTYQTSQTIAALARLGFDTDDSAGNFQIERPLDTPVDFASLADLMLSALHDGYGARSDTKLTIEAPFAPDRPAVCVRIS